MTIILLVCNYERKLFLWFASIFTCMTNSRKLYSLTFLKIGEITVETAPNARSGPRLRKRSAGIQYQVAVQLLAYADPSLVTPTNTIQMEWVRLAGELG